MSKRIIASKIATRHPTPRGVAPIRGGSTLAASDGCTRRDGRAPSLTPARVVLRKNRTVLATRYR
jgi:hypothetical protein